VKVWSNLKHEDDKLCLQLFCTKKLLLVFTGHVVINNVKTNED